MSKIKKWIVGVLLVVFIGVSAAFQSNFFEIAKQIDIYTTLFKELNMYYIDEVNPAKLTNDAVNHMLSNLDPYTRYYDEQGVEDARIRSTGDYGGIGAISRFNNKTLTIREVYKNSPAEKAGIKPGDKILKVGEIDVADFDEEGISALLNGLPNTTVKLQIERQNELSIVDVVRKKIEINPVPFYNFFIPKDKVVVTTKAKVEKWSDTFKTREEPLDLEIPVSILINNRSASASEILAGSLQDYDRAVIIGERSFGKGLVQRYLPLTYGTQMKLTISKYYTPSGRCIQELDYTNRDDKGNVPKFSDAGRETYKTAIGRTVYGGGGIFPDVEIEKPTTTKTTEVLLKSDAFFNYVTNYFYKNSSIDEPSKFKLNDNDFNDFKNYLANHQSDFETKTEIEFKKALELANKDDLSGSLDKNYEALISTVYSEKLQEIDKNKVEILDHLTEEIVKRYYYVAGAYQQKAVFDTTILKAVSVLNNTSNYQKMLKK